MRRLLIAVFLLLSCLPFTVSAGLVVIASNFDPIKPGAILQPDSSIELPEGKSLRLISASGAVFEIKGPYAGKLDVGQTPGDDSILKSISKLLKNPEANRYRLATFRNTQKPSLDTRQDIWGIDIRKPGKYCLQSSTGAMLWWPQSIDGETVKLTHRETGESVTMTWAGESKSLPWPSQLSIRPGARYSAETYQIPEPVELEILLLPAASEDPMKLLAMMSDHDCRLQANRLLGAIASQP